MQSRVPPGPNGLPVIGNTHQFFRNQLQFLTKCREKYGNIAKFEVGNADIYLITHPDDIERVLVSDADSYRKLDFDGPLGDVIGRGLLLHEGGEGWWEQRQRSQPAFRLKRFMTDQRIEAARTDVEQMMRQWNDNKTIIIHEEMVELAIKIISNALFRVNVTDTTAESIRQQLEPIGTEFKPNVARSVLPNWVPFPHNHEFETAHENLRDFIDDIVRERQRKLTVAEQRTNEAKESQTEWTDILTIMLRAAQEGTVDEERVRQELLTILLAGHDTTGLTLTYTWYLLAHHPNIEARLHEELTSVLGEEFPTTADLTELDYTEKILKETMRLYPPAYQTIRVPQKPVTLAGYRIPEGASIMVSQWATHHDSRWYDDPEIFNPDRWTKNDSDRPKYAYFPFGGGPRQCIGKPVAEVEMKLVLSTIAQRYRLTYSGTESLTFEPAVTLQPAAPIEMTTHKQ